MFPSRNPLSTALLRTALTTLVAIGGAFGIAHGAEAASLTVELQGSGAGNGQVMAALFKSPDGWMDQSKAVAKQAAPGADKVVMVFTNLAPGKYAISAFFDANGNGKLDSNVAGIPTEKYGFSRDSTGNFGPPGFDAAAVDLQADTAIVIHLH